MGADRRRSLVGPDLQAHDLPGLYVCDGSVLPTSPAVNPQLTIMAVARRAARALADQLA
jgi:choline dehydrogenase-like flavoprotein